MLRAGTSKSLLVFLMSELIYKIKIGVSTMESTSKSLDQVKIDYVTTMKYAISLLVCNYAGLNQAIDMGLDRDRGDQSHITLSSKVKMQELCEQVGGSVLRKASQVDLTKRILLIDALLELMMADTIESQDIEDMIDDYME